MACGDILRGLAADLWRAEFPRARPRGKSPDGRAQQPSGSVAFDECARLN
jgi:hypothetical protein